MTQAQKQTRKYREIAYPHAGRSYRIRWSPNAWALHSVSGNTWTRLETGEQTSKPCQLKGLIAMCEIASRGGKPGELYSSLLKLIDNAVSTIAPKPLLRSVPKPQQAAPKPVEPQPQPQAVEPSKPARKRKQAAAASAAAVDTKAPRYNREIVAEQAEPERLQQLTQAAREIEQKGLGRLRGNPTWDTEARDALVASAAAAEAALEAARQALLAVKAIRLHAVS